MIPRLFDENYKIAVLVKMEELAINNPDLTQGQLRLLATKELILNP